MLGEGILKQLNLQFEKKANSTEEWEFSGTYDDHPATFKAQLMNPGTSEQVINSELRPFQNLTHSNIVQLYDFHYEWRNARQYLVTVVEACDKSLATDMKQRLEHSFPYKEEELWTYAVTLIRTFAYMQSRGLAHRNIKPDNIFLSRGVIKVGGFRSVRQVDGSLSVFTVRGTPAYLSPNLYQSFSSSQQYSKHNVYKSDVYSLGITLFALATLQTPFSSVQEGNEAVRSMVDSLQLGTKIKDLMLRMLEWDEDNRCDFEQLDSWIRHYHSAQSLTMNPCQQVALPTLVPSAPASSAQRMSLPTPSAIPYHGTSPLNESPPDTASLHSEEKKYKKPHCLFCKNLVQMKLGSPVVQLKCSPLSHVYCSPKCLSAYINKQQKEGKQPMCSTCKAPIDDDDLAFYGVKRGRSFFSFIARLV